MVILCVTTITVVHALQDVGLRYYYNGKVYQLAASTNPADGVPFQRGGQTYYAKVTTKGTADASHVLLKHPTKANACLQLFRQTILSVTGTFEMPVTYSFRTTGCCNSDITVPFKVTIPSIQPNTPFQLIVDAGPIAYGSPNQPAITGYGEIRILNKVNIPSGTPVSSYDTIMWVDRCGVSAWHSAKTCSLKGIPAGEYVMYYYESDNNYAGDYSSTVNAYGAMPLKIT